MAVMTYDALRLLMSNVLGYNASSDVKYESYKGPAQAHPLFVADFFLSDPFWTTSFNFTYNIEGLAKLLAYGSFLQGQLNAKSIMESVQEEALKYPYEKKDTFK